jgi:hypothetical protein
VEWPAHTSGWALALGPPHPYKEFAARNEAGEHLASPVALRVFRGLPGVRVSATTNALMPIDAPHSPVVFIAPEIYGTVAQVLPPLSDDKSTLVNYDRSIGCITVHPRQGGLITVARMSVIPPKGAWGVTAQINLAHERASQTQFGLIAGAPGAADRELARLEKPDAQSTTFSGWRTLSPLEKRSISVLIAGTSEDRLSIYLVTRQAPDASPDFGWARFSKLEFNILPKTLTGENRSDERAPVLPPGVTGDGVTGNGITGDKEAAALGMEPNAGSL